MFFVFFFLVEKTLGPLLKRRTDKSHRSCENAADRSLSEAPCSAALRTGIALSPASLSHQALRLRLPRWNKPNTKKKKKKKKKPSGDQNPLLTGHRQSHDSLDGAGIWRVPSPRRLTCAASVTLPASSCWTSRGSALCRSQQRTGETAQRRTSGGGRSRPCPSSTTGPIHIQRFQLSGRYTAACGKREEPGLFKWWRLAAFIWDVLGVFSNSTECYSRWFLCELTRI